MAVLPESPGFNSHCLQRSECPHKITLDVQNCKGAVYARSWSSELTERYGTKLAIATGGLCAPLCGEYRPQAIVAIACERDLSSGIMDTNLCRSWGFESAAAWPLLCTQVDLDKLEQNLMFSNLKEPIPAPDGTRARTRSALPGRLPAAQPYCTHRFRTGQSNCQSS